MRIAVAGISHETNTFSTLRTRIEDFRISRGQECLENSSWDPFLGQIEFLPCLLAGATPNGLVEESAYLALKSELLQRLAATLPVDGIYLSLHGAMHVDGVGDGETDLLRDIRRLVGDEMPIVASLDLHGNLSPEFVGSVNVLTALRTAPHIDGLETRHRALHHLVRCIRDNKRPITAMKKLPLLLPGEYAVTAIEPSLSLYNRISELERMEGVWDASLMISCAWTDSPYTSVSTLVVAENAELARSVAEEYARDVWTRRKEFGPEVETISAEDAIARALEFTEGPVFLSESGDNVTAGGAGDVPAFLAQLIEANVQDALYAGICDPAAVKVCSIAAAGSDVQLSLGGKLDALNSKPLPVSTTVLKVEDGVATVRIGDIIVLITDTRRSFHTLDAFRPCGIDPLTKTLVVVKQGYLAPELRERCSTTFMALTPGFTDLRIETLPYREVVRPIYPLDEL